MAEVILRQCRLFDVVSFWMCVCVCVYERVLGERREGVVWV